MRPLVFHIFTCLAVLGIVFSMGGKVAAEENTVTLNVTDFGANGSDEVDDTALIQKALDANKDDGTQTTIIVPDGTYLITKTLKINSNTHLLLSEKAVIVRNNTFGPMLRNATGAPGFTGNTNIVIDGGTWDGNGQQFPMGDKGFDNLEFGHSSNITIQNTNVINNYGAHAIEFVGVQNGQVLNSKISGYFHSSKNQKKEAIQLDITHNNDVSYPFGYYDDTPCENIIIQGNTIENYSRGVGSHTTVKGAYPRNIVIQNNTFKNLTDEAIDALNYKNLTVKDNIFEDVGSGVEFTTQSVNPDANYNPNDAAAPITTEDQFSLKITGNQIIRIHTNPYQIGNGIILSGTIDYPIKGVTVQNNTISDCDENGIYLNFTSNASVLDNTVKNSKKYGIAIFRASEQNVLDNNTITSSGKNGIRLYGTAETFVKATQVTNNEIDKSISHGIYLEHAIKNVIYKNTVALSGEHGLYLNKTSTGNTVESNTIASSSKNGVTLNDHSTANVLNNTINSSKIDGISMSSSSSSSVVKGNMIKDIGQSGISILSKSVQNILDNNTITSSSKSLSSGRYGVWISDSSNNNTIRNNKINNSKEKSIFLSGTMNNQMISNTITQDRSHSNKTDGIYLDKANGNVLTANIITSPGGSAISMNNYSQKNKVSLNQVKYPKLQGIQVFYHSSADLTGNKIYYSGQNGIAISKYSTGNQAKDNTISVSTKNGVLIYDHSAAKMSGNKISNSKENGISISTYSNSSNLYKNTVKDSRKNGISIRSNSIQNMVDENDILRSSQYGIAVSGGSGKNVIKNNTINSSLKGIGLVGTKTKQVKMNTVSGNMIKSSKANGIYLAYASGNNILKNKLYSSGSSGIAIKYYSTKNTVDQNKLDRSKKHGIQVYSHSSASITKNNIYRSSENGVSISSYSNHSTISSNTIKYSGKYGIALSSHSSSNKIGKNTIVSCKKGRIYKG